MLVGRGPSRSVTSGSARLHFCCLSSRLAPATEADSRSCSSRSVHVPASFTGAGCGTAALTLHAHMRGRAASTPTYTRSPILKSGESRGQPHSTMRRKLSPYGVMCVCNRNFLLCASRNVCVACRLVCLLFGVRSPKKKESSS